MQPGNGHRLSRQPEPLPQGLGDPVAGPADFQRRAVPGVDQDPVEGLGAVGDEAAGHGRRDRPVPVQDGRFLGGAEQGHHRDGDQDLRPRRRHTPGDPGHPQPAGTAHAVAAASRQFAIPPPAACRW